MTTFKIPEYIKGGFDKYKYVLLVCVVGLGLALWPTAAKSPGEPVEAAEDSALAQAIAAMETELAQAFAVMEGVGRVQVILTVRGGSQSTGAYPTYLGAVVICDGGDDARVKLELTNAVKSLTGVTADHIVILKMKA